MFFFQQTISQTQCSEHLENDCKIEKVCFNEHCQDCRLLCYKCLQENKHSGHPPDVKQIPEFTSFMEAIPKQCDQFTSELQNMIDQSQELMNKLKIGINQKYYLTTERLNLMNAFQLSEALSEMFKLKNAQQQYRSELERLQNELNQTIIRCEADLQLSKMSYISINEKVINYLNHNYEESIEILNQQLDQHPSDYQAQGCKGACLKMIGEYPKAINSLDISLAINPRHVFSLFTKSECLGIQNKYNEALNLFDKALEIDPTQVFTLLKTGDARWFDQALESYPNHVFSLYQKGERLRTQGKYEDALIWLNRALSVNPKHVNTLGSKGACLRQQGKCQEALKFYEQALTFYPSHQLSLSGKSKFQYYKELCLEKLQNSH